MNKQSKKYSHYEIMVNQIVGVVMGWLIVFLLFPLFDDLDQFYVASISTCIFFVSSYARAYIIRRVFNEIH